MQSHYCQNHNYPLEIGGNQREYHEKNFKSLIVLLEILQLSGVSNMNPKPEQLQNNKSADRMLQKKKTETVLVFAFTFYVPRIICRCYLKRTRLFGGIFSGGHQTVITRMKNSFWLRFKIKTCAQEEPVNAMVIFLRPLGKAVITVACC